MNSGVAMFRLTRLMKGENMGATLRGDVEALQSELSKLMVSS